MQSRCPRTLLQYHVHQRYMVRQRLRQLASRLTWVAASTSVLVFPVPAGHKHTHTPGFKQNLYNKTRTQHSNQVQVRQCSAHSATLVAGPRDGPTECAAAKTDMCIPGGPQMMKGSWPEEPCTMQRTALACSGLLAMLMLTQCVTCRQAGRCENTLCSTCCVNQLLPNSNWDRWWFTETTSMGCGQSHKQDRA